MKIINKVAYFAFFLCLIIAILINVVAATNLKKEGIPFVFDLVGSKVISCSMEPEIMTGDYIVLKKINNDDVLVINNVYSYKYEDRFVLHRFLGYDKNGDLIFKGDANDGNDYPVKRSQVIAEYQYTAKHFLSMPLQSIILCLMILEFFSFFVIIISNKKLTKNLK